MSTKKQDAFKEPRFGDILHRGALLRHTLAYLLHPPPLLHPITAASWPSTEHAGLTRISGTSCLSRGACPQVPVYPRHLEDFACGITALLPFLTLFSDT